MAETLDGRYYDITPEGRIRLEFSELELSVMEMSMKIIEELSHMSDDAVGGYIALRDRAKAVTEIQAEND